MSPNTKKAIARGTVYALIAGVTLAAGWFAMLVLIVAWEA